MPSLAECGGFMYLHKYITDTEGKRYTMAGVIDGECTYTGKSVSRKIRSTQNGRNLYMDTNNSSDDFQVNDVAEVRRDNVGAPSWSPASK